MKRNPQLVGRWRITSMTEWDQNFVDEEVPGYFEFRKDGRGDFQFGYVRCDIDWRSTERGFDDDSHAAGCLRVHP